MSNSKLKFSEHHIWARPSDSTATIGISDYAQEELGEILVVDLPEIGDEIEKSEPFGEVESTKTVTELIAPVSGTVTEVNTALENNPGLINEDPYGGGWLVEVELLDPEELDELKDHDKYEKFIEE